MPDEESVPPSPVILSERSESKDPSPRHSERSEESPAISRRSFDSLRSLRMTYGNVNENQFCPAGGESLSPGIHFLLIDIRIFFVDFRAFYPDLYGQTVLNTVLY